MVVYKGRFIYDGSFDELKVQFLTAMSLAGLMGAHSEKFFPPTLKGDPPFAITGDNLTSHLNEVINISLEQNICFITLVVNSMHLCQQLDVLVFGLMERS